MFTKIEVIMTRDRYVWLFFGAFVACILCAIAGVMIGASGILMI